MTQMVGKFVLEVDIEFDIDSGIKLSTMKKLLEDVAKDKLKQGDYKMNWTMKLLKDGK